MSQPRVAIYTRVSTSDGRQDASNQYLELERFAVARAWEVTGHYTDQATGKNTNREGYQAMLSAAYRRDFDVLLVWSLDRLTREGTLKALELIQQLESWGVQFHSFTEQYLQMTGPFRSALIGIIASLAQYERERQNERIRAGLARAAQEGRRGGRPRCRLTFEQIIESGRYHRSTHAELALYFGVSVSTIRRTLNRPTTTSPCPSEPTSNTSTTAPNGKK